MTRRSERTHGGAGAQPRIERSEDGQTWEPIDYRSALMALSNVYRNVDDVFTAMRDGETVRTSGAVYRIVRD